MWTAIEGRQFLIESVEYPAAKPLLQTLPRVASAMENRGNGRWALKVDRNEVLVVAGTLPTCADDVSSSAKIQLASVTAPTRGFVLDYITVYNYGYGSYTFQSDTTYYVSSEVSFNDKVVIEGGTIVKFAPYNASALAQINITSGSAVVSCLTSMYRPAIFTARDDDIQNKRYLFRCVLIAL